MQVRCHSRPLLFEKESISNIYMQDHDFLRNVNKQFLLILILIYRKKKILKIILMKVKKLFLQI